MSLPSSASDAPLPPRPAARILLLDEADRLLLFRFTPADRAPFWVTPGGAVDPGESFADAARRELLEETGIAAEPGPEVARREVEFVSLEGVRVAADERYFLVRATAPAIATAGHTALERQVMLDWRWFTRADILAHPETIYPTDLVAMLEAVTGASR
jgi:8-oxo-dGTP diphosphatase